MKQNEQGKGGGNSAADKGAKVRNAVAEMLSSEERGKEPEREDSPGTLSSREPVPTAGGSPAEIAAQRRLAEIEQHVGALVKDPELEQDGAARKQKQ